MINKWVSYAWIWFVERERERESPRNLEANEFFFGFVLNGFLIRMGAHVKQRKRESISYSIQAWFRSEQITKMPLVSYNNHVRQHELLVVVVLLWTWLLCGATIIRCTVANGFNFKGWKCLLFMLWWQLIKPWLYKVQLHIWLHMLSFSLCSCWHYEEYNTSMMICIPLRSWKRKGFLQSSSKTGFRWINFSAEKHKMLCIDAYENITMINYSQPIGQVLRSFGIVI